MGSGREATKKYELKMYMDAIHHHQAISLSSPIWKRERERMRDRKRERERKRDYETHTGKVKRGGGEGEGVKRRC